jgi:uncharacterized protein (DUF1330 family)
MQSNYKLAIMLASGVAIGAVAVQGLHAQAKLPAYAVVEIDVTNQDAFMKEVSPIAAKALTDGGGKYLARGGKVVTIDGAPSSPRSVVIAFDNMEQAQAAFASPAYRDVKKIGDKYAKYRIWVVEGLAK